VTFLLVLVAGLLGATLALVGVYGLARQGTLARIEGFRDILVEDIATRFLVADQVVDTIATAEVVRAGDLDATRQTIYRFASGNAEYFDVIVLAEQSGAVISAAPAVQSPPDVSGEPYFRPDLAGDEAAFVWVHDEESGGVGRVWILHEVPQDEGDPVVLMARLRTGFLELLLNDLAAAEAQRATLVLDSEGDPLVTGIGSPELDPDSFVLEADDAGSSEGAVTASSPEVGSMFGHYETVDAGDLGWTVAVLEPESVAFEETRGALLPAVVAALVAVLIATLLARLFGRRLVAPLRVVESRAQEVASGAYIQPIEMDRDDEVGRLADAFNLMALRLNSLQDLSQLLASASELDQVLDGILSAMEHILQTGRTAVFLLDEEGGTLTLARASGAREPHPQLSIPVDGTSWVSQSFRSGKPVSFIAQSDPGSADPALELFGDEEVSSGLAVPLTIGRLPVGVALALSGERRMFSEAEMEMARTFSAQAAVAVQNSRLFEEEHDSRTEAEALREMAELLALPLGLEETLDRVGRIAAEILEMSDSYVAMSDRARDELLMPLSADASVDDAYLQTWEKAARLAASGLGEPVVIDDVESFNALARLARDRDFVSLIMIPMLEGERLRGVLVLECTDARRTYPPRELELAKATGKTVSVALESASLFQQARRRSENLETVFRISQAVSSSLQSTVVLNRVLDVVQKLLPADAVELMQYDGQRKRISTAMARGIGDRRLLHISVEPGEDIPGRVFEAKEPVRLDEVAAVDTPITRLVSDNGFRSWLCAPLLARGRSIGVLNAFSEESHAFTEEDTELIATFASQSALALDTAELFGREHAIASVLQSSIVPESLPKIHWLTMSSLYQPAGADSEIGGDYYDVFEAPDGRVVLVIGDVAGKGVPAATKTSMIKYTLRGLVSAGLPPAAALQELNSSVTESGDVGDIVTVWCGYLDPETGRLCYASGGHPPVFIRHAPAGDTEGLEPTGPVLGAIGDAGYDERVVALDDGATVLLYTDGVTEARREGVLFGEERVQASLASGGTPDEVIRRLVEDVSSYSGGVFRDDVAIVAVTFRPPAADAPHEDAAVSEAVHEG
jgi:serine phosphatase RsbU (regulator of sigma subunit)/HAMP domain-containing protein